MYLALKKLDVRMPDLSVAEIKPGTEVPGFAEWAPWTRKAMLDGHMVTWAVSGKLAPHEQEMAERVVHQPLPRGPLGAPAMVEAKVREPSLYVPATPNPHGTGAGAVDGDAVVYSEEPDHVVSATLTATAAPAMGARDRAVGVDRTPPAKGAHDCPVCDKQGFKDFHGLKIHMARAHKEA